MRDSGLPGISAEVLIVGGGPAGAAAAFWLATHGHAVTIIEKRTFPREKTCGDALTPRAVRQLDDMGLSSAFAASHRHEGVRVTGLERELTMQWPEHSEYGRHGYVIRRAELDTIVAEHAVAAGATLLQGHEAVRPLVSRGFVRGAVVQGPTGAPFELMAKYVVVADGANSRFGRSLGTIRSQDWPYATAIRAYWTTPRHAEPWIESALDLRDRNDRAVPGYGWVFPAGDGTANIGVGLLSTFRDFKTVNTAHLLEAYVARIAERWQLDPSTPLRRPVSGRIPMGGSVAPTAGPTYLVVGDAAGVVNPFNGDGIDYAYETARLAADVLHDALATNDASSLQRYSKQLDDRYGQYFKVARLFARIVGRPVMMREMTRIGLHNRTLMEWALRIMSNELRPDETGPAELAYGAMSTVAKFAPNA
ncbi:MAG: geranylgeranyl reductase family protein [Ilumatobacteraceae bacterium]|nr:geranylgeranyl reductase family protein [Ilumatobacteraceae bacterium]